jgi:hypothetical protein
MLTRRTILAATLPLPALAQPRTVTDMARRRVTLPATIARWIKTDCGRSQYLELATRPGSLARLRLAWFVLIAGLRDWRLADRP